MTNKNILNQMSLSSTEDEDYNVMTSSWGRGSTTSGHVQTSSSVELTEEDEEVDEVDDMLDCTSLSQSYHNEWKKLFMRKHFKRTLKSYALKGALRISRFRSVCWKIFLDVLGDDMNRWSQKTLEWRKKYDELKIQLIVNPRKAEAKNLSINNPLSQEVESPWNQFFMDNELRLTIKQDVIRTYPKIEFYHTDGIRTTMVDILFIYAKLNPHISYRQGMHELLAPLIFVLHCDHLAYLHACELEAVSDLIREVLDPEYLEHDAFSLFFKLMETVEPWYVSPETNSDDKKKRFVTPPFARPQDLAPSNIIVNKLIRIQDYLLKRFDAELHDYLQKMDIVPQLYGIRWLRLLFGREFLIQDMLLLWDAIFSDGVGFELVDYIFVTMLMYLRHALLTSDYPSCLYLLMKYPAIGDVHYFINKSMYLRDPKNKPVVVDQFFQKPSNYGANGYEKYSRNGQKVNRKGNVEPATMSTSSFPSRFSRFVGNKRPGSLMISSGSMSKSTSEPMNLITDSILSPVHEDKQYPVERKASSASLPPPDVGTPIALPNMCNVSCQSLTRLDGSFRHEEGSLINPTSYQSLCSTGESSADIIHGGKFFIFGARGGRKHIGGGSKTKQMKNTSEQEVLKALNSYNEMETICRKCSVELEIHIKILQKHVLKHGNEEEVLALAGIKQVRDVLKGALKPSFLFDSPEHLNASTSITSSNMEGSLATTLATLRRKQHQSASSAQSSLACTPLYEKPPHSKFFLATPDANVSEVNSPEVSLEISSKLNINETVLPPKKKPGFFSFSSLRTPTTSKSVLTDIELGDVNRNDVQSNKNGDVVVHDSESNEMFIESILKDPSNNTNKKMSAISKSKPLEEHLMKSSHNERFPHEKTMDIESTPQHYDILDANSVKDMSAMHKHVLHQESQISPTKQQKCDLQSPQQSPSKYTQLQQPITSCMPQDYIEEVDPQLKKCQPSQLNDASNSNNMLQRRDSSPMNRLAGMFRNLTKFN